MSVMYIRDKNGNFVPVQTIKGKDGVTPEFSIGTVETLDAASEATASITGTAEKPVLNLGIPQGKPGTGGASSDYEIPDYWQEHLDTKIAAVKEFQDVGGKDCFSFVVMTDTHHYSNLGKLSPALAEEICRRTGAKFILNLGDMQNRGSWATKEMAEAEWEEINTMFEPIRDRLLSTQGNHDGSWGSTLNGVTYPYNYTVGEIFERVYRKTVAVNGVHTDSTGTAYYVDDAACKVRYILLNTHCNPTQTNEDGSAKYNNTECFRFTQAQYDFLTGEALTTGLSDGWAVVIAAHAPVCNVYSDLFGGDNGDHVVMRNLLKAYRNKTAYSGVFAGTAGGGAAYTNVAGTITADVRLSSSGLEKESAGAAATDYIACKAGDVLRIKGLDIASEYLPDASNSPTVAVYDSGKTFITTIYPKTYPSVFTTVDGVTMYTLFVNDSGEQISLSDASYIRICGTPVNGESVIVTINEEIAETESGYDAVSVDADFTNAKGELVGYFSGHIHDDIVYGYTDWGINIITHRCDAAQENDSALLAERVAGTTTEQSFDVVTVNKATRKICCTKIGAGSDRVISY